MSVDTSSLSGTAGYLDFGFAGLTGSPAATSFVHAVSGGLALGAPLLDGAAIAELDGWRLGNDGAFNAVFQSWQFGSSLQFTIDFGGAWQTATTGSGNTFSLKLWDGEASSTLMTADAAGTYCAFNSLRAAAWVSRRSRGISPAQRRRSPCRPFRSPSLTQCCCLVW